MRTTPAKLLFLMILGFVSGCAQVTPVPKEAQVLPERPPPRIALVLGGGAARGFAHVGVLKVLEKEGIVPQVVVGVSAGSVVGALYAAGYRAADLERAALELDEWLLGDWSVPDRGIFKGERLQNFVKRAVQGRPLEKLNRTFAVGATDLQSGEHVLFRMGDTGIAVRASSSVPGIYQPVQINGRDYVDGAVSNPVPVQAARALGADLVIAVDVSARPAQGRISGTLEVLLQSLAIMGQAIAAHELRQADVVIRPDTSRLSAIGFDRRRLAIAEGERAAVAALPRIRELIARGARFRN